MRVLLELLSNSLKWLAKYRTFSLRCICLCAYIYCSMFLILKYSIITIYSKLPNPRIFSVICQRTYRTTFLHQHFLMELSVRFSFYQKCHIFIFFTISVLFTSMLKQYSKLRIPPRNVFPQRRILIKKKERLLSYFHSLLL